VGFWDVVTGRSRSRGPDLDTLFAVPSVAVGLEAGAGFRPTGVGTVCFRSAGGAADVQVRDEIRRMLDDDPDVPDDVVFETDGFGYTWLVVRRGPGTHEPSPATADQPRDECVDVASLCTDLHGVNSTLAQQGLESGLLCTMVPFEGPAGERFGLVYLYKQGTYYPFAPAAGQAQARDTLLELRIRDLVAGELPVEADTQRWLALWGAPGL